METEIITAYIGLGSNLGDRAGNLLLAVRGLLEAGLTIKRLSAVYETEPIGVEHKDRYLNMVAEITFTNISPSQIMARMIRLEYLLGRRHKFLKTPRTVDLDLLFYGDLRIDTEFLKVPHPHLHRRKFVLIPLAELAPRLVHPGLKKPIAEILEDLADSSEVNRWNQNSGLDLSPESSQTQASSTN